MASPPPSICATAVAIAIDSAEESKPRLTSGELHIGGNRYELIEYDGRLRQDFPSVLNLSPSTRIALRYKTSASTKRENTHEINTHQLFANFSVSRTQDIHDGIHIVFACQAHGTLTPTTDVILEDCPQFRILVIGESGVGKSSLIHSTFGISNAHSSDFVRGRADINVGLHSPVNERFILHDSLGFGSADPVNYDTVKEFIRNRRTGPLKDQLHAIWFCVPIPRVGARLLEVAAEDFFETKKETMGTIPLIVVYTKLDLTVNDQLMKLAASHSEPDAKILALLESESHVKKSSEQIDKLAREPLPYAIVSTEPEYRYTLRKLVELTYRFIGIHDTSEVRVDPMLQGAINVGRKRYWETLKASLSFQRHAVLDCLCLVHSDIVAIWNFNDPAQHLPEKKFMELIVEMAQEVETRRVYNPITATKNVQQIFIAYIVDLTHVLETLYILTSREHKKLTLRAIKAAYNVYYQSDVRTRAHADIQDYQDLHGRDAALEKIESLIKPEQGDDANVKEYYARVSELDLGTLNLDQEEEW